MSNFKIEGIKEIQKILKQLEPKVAKKMYKKAMRPAMKVVQKEAKAAAPKDSGLLRKSIKVRAAKRSRKYIGIDVLMGEGDFKGETYYGAFQEYGTSKTPPKGFMRKAFDNNKDSAKQAVIADLKRLIENEASKG